MVDSNVNIKAVVIITCIENCADGVFKAYAMMPTNATKRNFKL